jgi:hypothetical protein
MVETTSEAAKVDTKAPETVLKFDEPTIKKKYDRYIRKLPPNPKFDSQMQKQNDYIDSMYKSIIFHTEHDLLKRNKGKPLKERAHVAQALWC